MGLEEERGANRERRGRRDEREGERERGRRDVEKKNDIHLVSE